MKAMIRSLSAWKVLVMRLVGAVPNNEAYFVQNMYRKVVHEKVLPSEAEAIRLDSLNEKYRAAI